MIGLFCRFVVVSAAVRPGLSGVGCLWCLPGPDGRAGLPSACGAPPLCPRRVGRAGLPSACGAPPRVFVLRVSSPCRSFSLARPPLARVCPAQGRALVFVAACCCSRTTPSHLRPPLRLLFLPPPFALWCPVRAGGCAPPPPLPGGLRFAPGVVLRRVFPCCVRALWLPCAAVPFVGASCCPPPPPGLCFAGVVALPPVFLCPAAAALYFPVPLALAPDWLGFFSPPRLAAVRRCVRCMLVPCPPPPAAVAPGGMRCSASCCAVPRWGVGCFLRRAVFCCAMLCF